MKADAFDDIERLRLPTAALCENASKSPDNLQTKPKRISGEFLKGPVPMSWLSAAIALGGKAPMAVGLAIWFQHGRGKSAEIRLTSELLRRFSVNRKSKYAGLAALEKAGLIKVRRELRKNPIVEILNPVK